MMINRIKWQLALAALWFGRAYLARSALLPGEWAWRWGWFNVILGLVGLLVATRTEVGDRLFYQGLQEGERSVVSLGLLWTMALAVLVWPLSGGRCAD